MKDSSSSSLPASSTPSSRHTVSEERASKTENPVVAHDVQVEVPAVKKEVSLPSSSPVITSPPSTDKVDPVVHKNMEQVKSFFSRLRARFGLDIDPAAVQQTHVIVRTSSDASPPPNEMQRVFVSSEASEHDPSFAFFVRRALHRFRHFFSHHHMDHTDESMDQDRSKMDATRMKMMKKARKWMEHHHPQRWAVYWKFGFPTQDDMRLRGDFNENSIVNTLSNENTKVSNSEKRDMSLSTPSSTDEAVENVHFFKWMIGIVLALNLLLVACASRKIRRAALRSPPAHPVDNIGTNTQCGLSCIASSLLCWSTGLGWLLIPFSCCFGTRKMKLGAFAGVASWMMFAGLTLAVLGLVLPTSRLIEPVQSDHEKQFVVGPIMFLSVVVGLPLFTISIVLLLWIYSRFCRLNNAASSESDSSSEDEVGPRYHPLPQIESAESHGLIEHSDEENGSPRPPPSAHVPAAPLAPMPQLAVPYANMQNQMRLLRYDPYHVPQHASSSSSSSSNRPLLVVPEGPRAFEHPPSYSQIQTQPLLFPVVYAAPQEQASHRAPANSF